MNDNQMISNWLATSVFGLAILHTFLASAFHKMAYRFPKESSRRNIFYLLGEVEVIFGFWAGVYLCGLLILNQDPLSIVEYLESLNFTEPAFVFVVMSIASTKPVLFVVKKIIESLVVGPRNQRNLVFFWLMLILGPLLGSFITEPAAMTVTALLLEDRFLRSIRDRKFQYGALAVLFVNISIGGTLTSFAAPPVLMVAKKWNWDFSFMLQNYGWKAILAILCNATILTAMFRRQLQALEFKNVHGSQQSEHIPLWVIALHLIFLGLMVLASHYMVVFLGLFLFFLGMTMITRQYQRELKLRESLLVAFFLGGLVVLGGPQGWWLSPLLQSLNETSLFLGATFLTSFTDNAALTYLGSQVENLSDAMKYMLVAGAVAGGGMTVIANAPNPAGYSILKDQFGAEGINPLKLALAAIGPTLIAMSCFYFL